MSDATKEASLNYTQRELLIRIDERTKNLVKRFDEFEMNQSRFVSREEFAPIQKLVYGVVGLILVSVFGALVSLVVMQ